MIVELAQDTQLLEGSAIGALCRRVRRRTTRCVAVDDIAAFPFKGEQQSLQRGRDDEGAFESGSLGFILHYGSCVVRIGDYPMHFAIAL